MARPRVGGFVKTVRLPQALKDAMEEHEKRSHLPESIQIRVALEQYLSGFGLWPYPPQVSNSKKSRSRP